MKYFYSYYPTSISTEEDIFFNLISIKLSSTILRKLNKRVGIYSNKKFIELLKQYNVELDFYEDIESEIKHISSDELFAVCKLYSNIIQNEPFIQLDTDLFLFDNFNFELLESSSISFYYHEQIDGHACPEQYNGWNETYLNPFNILSKTFPNLIGENTTNPLCAYNCAIVGGNDWKLFSELYVPILEIIKDNKTYLEKFGRKIMCVLEQHIITGKLNKMNYTSSNINFATNDMYPLFYIKDDIMIFQIDDYYSITSETELDWIENTSEKLLFLTKEKFKGVLHLAGSKWLTGIKSLIYAMLKNYDLEYVNWLENTFGKQFKFQK
jgi:hypothetical protein